MPTIYASMLTNIASDLDHLLTDLVHRQPYGLTPGQMQQVVSGTQSSGDTLGKDSILAGGPASHSQRTLGDTTASSQSLASSSSDNLSADSGHDGRTQAVCSPLVFHPNHFGSKLRSLETATASIMTVPAAPSEGDSQVSVSSGDLRPITLVERLTKTHTIWLLSQMSRAGAVHLLKDRETGVFLIRKSSQCRSLALSVQNRQSDRASVDHYLIEGGDYGMRLQGSVHFFHSVPSLIDHYIQHLDELPYRLTLPAAILQARSSRELASLAMLGQDFWHSPVSWRQRGGSPAPESLMAGPSLHKSCSEPIDIRQQSLHTAGSDIHGLTAASPRRHQVSTSRSVANFAEVALERPAGSERQHVICPQACAACQSHTHHEQSACPTCSLATHSSPRRVFASPSTEARLGFTPYLLRLGRGVPSSQTLTDSSGDESCGGVPFVHLVRASPQLTGSMSNASSQTDFSSLNIQPLSRPNLYSMTPIELLQLPENSYFRSTLSDKMSDYEDIWRSSYVDSDSAQNGSVHSGMVYDGGSADTRARWDFTKFFAINGGPAGVERCKTPPLAVVTVSVPVTMADSIRCSKPATCLVPPVSSASIPQRTKSFKNRIIHPLVGRLSRLKSSSDSSIATIASPVYAEPADAVVFREKQSLLPQCKTRRRSAPSVSSSAFPCEAPAADISSPLVTKGAHELAAHDVISTADLLSACPKRAEMLPKRMRSLMARTQPEDMAGGRGGSVARSQSMRTGKESARLGLKRPGWQERFHRLKLGTKVLLNSSTPYAASVSKVQPQLVDSDIFEDVENHSSIQTSLLHPFPVCQHSRFSNSNINRESYFSESSTVQDIISSEMPELVVHPPQLQQLVVQAEKPLSEYDNFSPYAPPSASSHSTVFCTPWEGGVVDTLIRSSVSSTSQLPPAMDLQERVLKWQEANQSFQQHYHQHQQLLQQQSQHKVNSCATDDQGQGQLHGQMPVMSQQQLAVVKQAHNIQTANVVSAKTVASAAQANSTVGMTNNAAEAKTARVKPQPLPRHKVAVLVNPQPRTTTAATSVPMTSPARSSCVQKQQRPMSMLLQGQDKHRLHVQLVRSLSNPSSAQQQVWVKNEVSQSVQGPQHQGCPQSLDTDHSSTVIPDVINCHHIAMETESTADISDDEVLMPSVFAESTLQHDVHHKQPQHNPGNKIREYIYKLSQDHSTTFGSTIENFIQCTVDSQERNPHYVLRNVRQFMSGIRNYLVKHGEGQLEEIIERERNKLATNEILNIDSLIETTLHVCVLRPLKHHIYRLFVDFHGRNNSLESMSRNIKYARTKSAEEIGIKPGLVLPQATDMEKIKQYLEKMQRAYSPLKKLENLLVATSTIYSSVKIQGSQVPSRGPASLGADDFLPLLIYVLVHCGLVSAEIEADYMWGLLHPSVLTGEGGYYLTTLSSAVLILKNFQQAQETKASSQEGNLPCLGEVQGFLKIAFPDELRDILLWKTLPVRPNMSTKDVCAMIAHKFKITNPQDYGLILLCNGQESQLADNQCPQIIKRDNLASGQESIFAYKRLGANIAWPSSMKQS